MRIHAFITPVLIAPVLASLLLTGCAGSVPAEPAGGGSNGPASTPPATPPSDPTPPVVDPTELQGRWQAVELSPAALVPGKEPRLTLQADRIGVLPGCNTMGGSYRIEGNTLITDGLTSTMMGCPEELMAQERAVAELLEGDPQWFLERGRFTLIDGERRLVLVRDTSTPQPPPAPSGPVEPPLTPAPGQR
ncbi:hypothetical protein CGZ94_00445 [Enemella evansiae]|uniref:DUF306 domain-containing protein n=1 Tax=Enemella evansiae TaxID=2016499 RepID=A0A255GVZ5_9ACTN|nr:META domain-containing protein [Enemella evansiae]OYO17414.1 hypothetical protein CGZ94_00445 [Enemella evansiae]